MPTTITLIRHAESEMNAAGDRIGGRSNHTPLTPAGHAAATRYGRQLATQPRPAAFYCTSATRSRQTAELIAAAARWPQPDVEDGLLELSQGSAEGQPRGDWWTSEAITAMQADPLHHRLSPDAENHADVQARMTATLQRLARRHPNQQIAAVGHGIAIRTLVWSITGGSHRDAFQHLTLGNLDSIWLTIDPTQRRPPAWTTVCAPQGM